MKRSSNTHFALLAVVLAVMAPGAARAQSASDDWAGLFRECERAGLQAGAIERIAEQCRERKISAETAGDMLAPACEAARSGLPVEPVLAKVREGLAKNVPADAITEVSRNRVQHLIRARELTQHRNQPSRRGEEGVVSAVALALESGCPDEVLQDVLTQSAERRSGDIQALVEVGESLTLNGFTPQDTRTFMMDCLQRNLRRTEMLRAGRYAVQRHGAGMEAPAIRKALWGSDAAGTSDDGGGHRVRAQQRAQRTGAAGGPGADAGAGLAPPRGPTSAAGRAGGPADGSAGTGAGAGVAPPGGPASSPGTPGSPAGGSGSPGSGGGAPPGGSTSPPGSAGRPGSTPGTGPQSPGSGGSGPGGSQHGTGSAQGGK